ncbi:glutamate-1-semialdehyde 2,1-aminomutase [Gammaproteobacteria bacterium]|nr:glutamate-1-semialdehyde 2,1-aminomutase [Gammaproteobacteria bacterium]MDA8916956.1 glutamate-1-semialdehyde 2,1-aminomutase [Gammaproteobacteria bacterium]MDA9574791.1 glutamate-1-semialdehyde 2,1-aminomutase [Gammaproteobacteria bacterium]MDA9920596.1 glutamate-1-semialdehyde 2,1-aminomutase [Gammaproteobacteria bacterium]MDB2503390.1 glutamate-1-semialdehyde 2,1-aminomutase [Gammaproteobacteria bacterium]
MKLNNIEKSIALFNQAKLLMPGGVNSPVRAFKNINGNPIFFEKAKGAYLFDADGNEYIDYIGSWGPMIMGHSHPKIVDAIKTQADLGTSYGAPTGLESDVASLIIQCIPSIEKIRMVNSGTEATMSTIRLARGYTNKNKIIKFDGCYHGHVDSLLIKAGSGVSTFGLPDSPGIPKDLAKHTITCPYNDVEAFEKIFHEIKDDLAAVIVEPVAGNMGFVPGTKKFLETLREKTSSSNSLLIFDEVMSGFRVSLGGAQEIYNIKPDLTALGKVIGGGLPVGAFGGKKDIMDYLAPVGPVYQAGTLSGNPLAMAAGSTLLNLIIKENPFELLEANAKELLGGMRNIMNTAGIPFSTNQMGGMFGFFFSEKLPENIVDVSASDDNIFALFLNACIRNGIYFAPSKFEAGFISTKHGNNEIHKTLEIIENIIKTGVTKNEI